MPYNYDIYSDIDLVEMIRLNHDDRAFQELYLRYADALFKLAYRKTDDRAAAEDIVQITFIKLWSSKEHLKINHSLKAYLYTSAKNNIISYYLRKLNKNVISLSNVDENLLPEYNGTQQHVDHSEMNSLYNQSLEELPDKCREVFVLSRSGFTLKEIAQIKNISPKTAEVHISKALRLLRKKLKGHHLLVFVFLLT